MKVLIVDDEPPIVESLERRLRKEGYSTFSAGTAEHAMRLFKQVRPDLVLLDVNLPGRTGFELCQTLRQESTIPIIFVTARTDMKDALTGLDQGGDDYITKPFQLSEVVARVRAVLRRTVGESSRSTITAGNLVIDPKRHAVTKDGELVDISPKEFQLIYFFASNPGQVFSREALLDRVWGQESYVSPRTVDVHVRWLREKFEDTDGPPARLITVRGVGYKFVG